MATPKSIMEERAKMAPSSQRKEKLDYSHLSPMEIEHQQLLIRRELERLGRLIAGVEEHLYSIRTYQQQLFDRKLALEKAKTPVLVVGEKKSKVVKTAQDRLLEQFSVEEIRNALRQAQMMRGN